MNLLEFSIETEENLNKLSGKEYAQYFVKRRSKCWNLYQKGLVTSSSHGADFFKKYYKILG